MSSTNTLQDFSDLYTDLLNRVHDQTDTTAIVTIAKRFINTALFDMHIGYGEQFPWAERHAVLRTHPTYSTGTATTAVNSTSVTGGSTAWNTDSGYGFNNVRAGGKFLFGSETNVYEVDSVTNDTTAVLTSMPLEVHSAGTYIYYEDQYALASDFLRPIDQRRFSSEMEIELIDRSLFRALYPRNSTRNRPTVGTIVDRQFGTDTVTRYLLFHPPPDQMYMIPYTYVTSNLVITSGGTLQTRFSSDDDQPIMPVQYRHAIVMNALYHWYRDRKDDTRSAEARLEYMSILSRISSDTEIGAKRPRIRPRTGPYWNAARNPWRGSGTTRYDINGKFDRFEI